MMVYASGEYEVFVSKIQVDMVCGEQVVSHVEVQLPFVRIECFQGERDIPASLFATADNLDECMVIVFGGTQCDAGYHRYHFSSTCGIGVSNGHLEVPTLEI